MSTAFSVTELSVAARCARQMLFAREGFRVSSGGAGIGQAAHAVLAAFVEHGARHPALERALEQDPADEDRLLQGVVEAVYREYFDRAGALAAGCTAAEVVGLGRIVFQLAPLLRELLVRARRSGLSGADAFARTLEASERRVSLELDGGRVLVHGAIDLLCRDLQRNKGYVVDLKTGLTDVAAEEQVRLYALALARSGERFQPALAYASRDALEIKSVEPFDEDAERALDGRVRALAEYVEGRAVPPPAADLETCRNCPVQKPCWSRWGRTLHDEGRPSAPATGEVAEEAIRLERSLRAHRIRLDRIDPALAVIGPNVVRFRIALREGENIAKLARSAHDVQREMSWPAAPLVCNAGSYVAIDAPRRDREVVPWRAVPLEETRGLEVPVGLTLERRLLKLDLGAAPHLLVAGTTGSGKSVFLQGLALSLLDRLPRSECEVVIVDPKMLDFPRFNALPLQRPVITDPEEAIALLRSLVDEEMPRRTARLAGARVAQRTELPRGAEPMPALVVIVDEFADLVAGLPDKAACAQFIGDVQRLLQRSRAVGIHLVLATQRPSVDAIPGQLKANLPVRLAFKLPSTHDSQTVLDEVGAENLLGRGDLLLKRDGETTRAQAFLVSPDDVERTAAKLHPRPAARP